MSKWFALIPMTFLGMILNVPYIWVDWHRKQASPLAARTELFSTGFGHQEDVDFESGSAIDISSGSGIASVNSGSGSGSGIEMFAERSFVTGGREFAFIFVNFAGFGSFWHGDRF
jgi:hypothetical protein